jgi:hypothetical protein
MTKAPDGAQLSEDGQYWWDGSEWQPNAEDGTAETSPEEGEITSARSLTPEQVMFVATMLGTEGDDEQPVPDMDPESEPA